MTDTQKAILKDKLQLIYKRWIVDSLVVQGYPCNDSIAKQIQAKANFIADNLMLNYDVDDNGLFPLLFLKTSSVDNNGTLTVYTEMREPMAKYAGVVTFVDDSLQVHLKVADGIYNRDCISVCGITGVPCRGLQGLTEGDTYDS